VPELHEQMTAIIAPLSRQAASTGHPRPEHDAAAPAPIAAGMAPCSAASLPCPTGALAS